MKQVLIFLAGFVFGVFVTLFILFVFSLSISHNYSSQVQYIEVNGKKGSTTLYTGMPKDSVKMLLGKPDKVDFNEFANTPYEKWGYKINNQHISDLDIDFENGRLKGVSQN
jgi:hypothetical protein